MGNRHYHIAGDILFSTAIFRLSKGSKDIKLSNKEAELLELLCEAAGNVISRGVLQESLWPNQDNMDTNLNRQILSLRRKLESLGLLDAIDTIPRVGYIFCAPVEMAEETEPLLVVAESCAENTDELSPPSKMYSRRKYDRYLRPKHILLCFMLSTSLLLLARITYNYFTTNRLKTIELGHVSLYMTNNTEKLFDVKIDALAQIARRIPKYKSEHVSILVGKEAISYFTIDNKNQQLSENVFLLRSDHPITEEMQCVMATMALQGENVTNNYYNNVNTTIRYHSNCQAQGDWVELTRTSKIIVTTNREIVVAHVVATGPQQQTLLDLDYIGDLKRHDNDYVIEVKNTIINMIVQQALTNNSLIAAMVAALTPPKQQSKFIQLPAGMYFSNYMGGVLSWPARNSLKVIQRNDL